MTKERYQNPVVNDTINLRLIAYNSNNLANVDSIHSVDIYQTDCGDKRLVETIDGTTVQVVETGQYLLPLVTTSPKYVIGKYSDVWNVVFEESDVPAKIANDFQLYADLWYTTVIPAVYSFDFRFQPNRVRQGSKRWLIIQIVPNVPRATDLERYYQNLAITSSLFLSLEQTCGPCVPQEQDLRLILDRVAVEVREKVFGYYFFDTTELDCGIYNIWFEMNYAGNVDISPKFQIQVF